MNSLISTETWPVENSSAGWINKKGQLQTIGDIQKKFPLASVTKPLFALTILIAVEEGTLSLDQSAGQEGATIRHLLSHSSGLSSELDPQGNPTILSPAGKRRIYSNAGYEILGKELEKASGMKAAEYFHEALVVPLQLQGTTLHGSPAKNATSTVEDLLKVSSELMNPTLLSPATIRTATTTHLPALSGVLPGFGKQTPNPWGLGFEVKSTKSPHWTALENSPRTFGHFGQSGTFFWVDPLAELSCVALTDKPFGTWTTALWPELSKSVLEKSPK